VTDAGSDIGVEVVRQLLSRRRRPVRQGELALERVTALTTEPWKFARAPFLAPSANPLVLEDVGADARPSLGAAAMAPLRLCSLKSDDDDLLDDGRFDWVVSTDVVPRSHDRWTLAAPDPFMSDAEHGGEAGIDVADAARAIAFLLVAADPPREKRFRLTGPRGATNDVEELTGLKPITFADFNSKRPAWRRNYRHLLPFTEVRKMARGLGLDTKDDFDDWLNNGGRGVEFGGYFPQKPDELYEDDWRGWDDFLGARRSYDDAKRELKQLGLTTRDEWQHFTQNYPDVLADLRIPVVPEQAYRADFKGFDDWLGTPPDDDGGGDRGGEEEEGDRGRRG